MHVLVVGGGPAGCACAIALAKAGFSVRLMEAKHAAPKAGEVIPPSSLADLEELGLSQSTLDRDHLPCSGVDRVWGSDDIARVDYTSRLAHGWHVDRQLFENALLDLCRDVGAQVSVGTAVREAVRTAAGWQLHFDDGTEDVASFLVDASGRRAVIANQLDVGNDVKDRLIAFHAIVDHNGHDTAQPLFIEAVESGWWYTTPLCGERRVFAFLTDSDLPAAHRAAKTESFNDLLRETRLVSQFLTLAKTGRPRAWAATSRRLHRFSGPGWLAIGDAAIGRDPLSGGGIAQALRDGQKAAAVIEDCHKAAVASPTGFDEYLKAVWDSHEVERKEMYGAEHRWPWSPFWARRSGRG